MKAIIYHYAIIIHILCGAFALITGTVAMSAKKGGKNHNQAGSIFYWAMFGVFITTLVFFVLYPTQVKYQFFLTIGIVSFYPNFAGKRALGMKKAINPTLIDWIAAWVVSICGVTMWTYAIYSFIHPMGLGMMAILFMIFGSICLQNGYSDLKLFFNKENAKKMHWFFSHGAKMTGAFTAAVTAFCVNIVPRSLPENTPQFVFLLSWIVPGVIIGIFGARVLKSYRKKMKLA